MSSTRFYDSWLITNVSSSFDAESCVTVAAAARFGLS